MPGIFQKIASPVRGLNQAAYLLALLTLVSQILALLRDRIFAHTFGANSTLDMYYAAFKIPDLVFALVASLVSAYVLIPRMSGMEKGESRELLSQAASFLLLAGGMVSIVLAIAAPYYIFLLFPSFNTVTLYAPFVLIVRLLLVQPILLGLSGILGSVTQLHRRFILFALSPVLYNAGIIFGTVFLYPQFGIAGIGLGVILGAFAHLLINVPTLIEARLFPRLRIPNARVILSLMRSSIPRSLALGMGSLTTISLLALANRLGSGSISIFTLGGNLEAVPFSLIGAAYATAAFPTLSKLHGEGKKEEFRTTLTSAARQVILWSSIIVVFTIVLRAHIVRVILGSGAFNWDATRLTAAVLALMVLSLVAQGIILLAARAFYAANRSWNPLFVQLFDCGVSVLSAWMLLRLAQTYPALRYFAESLFRLNDVPGSEVLFIAAGFTIGQLVLGLAALLTLRTVAPSVARSLVRPMLEALGSALLGGAAAYVVLLAMGSIAPLSSLLAVVAQVVAAGIVGGVVTAGALLLLRNREFLEIISSLRKLRGSRVLQPFAPISNDQLNP